MLLDEGADIEARDDLLRTPLMYAYDCKVLELLLKRGANVNAPERGKTALHFCASEHWSHRAAQLLVSAGADVMKASSDGNTPVMVALKANNFEMAMKLLKLGARGMNIEINSLKETVFHVISWRHIKVSVRAYIQALVAAGANLEVRDYRNYTPLLTAACNFNKYACRKLLELGADVNAVSMNGNTALHLAAMCGHLEAVQELVTLRANVEAKNRDHNTALHLAAMKGHVGCVTALVSTRANTAACNDNGLSALHVACINGHSRVAKALVASGADIEARDRDGNTPLLLALKNRFKKVATELIEAGASVNARNGRGRTALGLAYDPGDDMLCCQLAKLGAKVDKNVLLFPRLEHAVITADHDFLKLFLQAGALVNERGTAGLTLLHMAASRNFDTVKLLLDHGADPCASADNGSTPLHGTSAAALNFSEQVRITRLLLARGADPTAQSNQGKTPLAVAKEKPHFNPITTILEREG